MKTAVAFAPCHITGVFQIFDESADTLCNGSKGAGVSLVLGAKTTVDIKEASDYHLRVSINDHSANSAEVSRNVVNAFLTRLGEKKKFEIAVKHQIGVPIGAGFGTSGAGALSLALALNRALDLGMSRIEAAQIAHIAEVECKTGLGTVLAETFGGLEIRVKPGAPGIGEIKCLLVPENAVVACHVLGPLSTRRSLTNPETRTRINSCGSELVNELVKAPTIINFMRLSRQFAEHVGLISQNMRTVLTATDKAGIVCSMSMFGDSVFTITDEENVEKIGRIFQEHGPSGQTIMSKIDQKGARIL